MIRPIPHIPLQITAIALIWLSGCTEQQRVKDIQHEHAEMGGAVQSWIGISQAEIREMLGPPSQVVDHGSETLHIYYFLDGGFAAPEQARQIDPDDPESYECRFRITYVEERVKSVHSDGANCVAEK